MLADHRKTGKALDIKMKAFKISVLLLFMGISAMAQFPYRNTISFTPSTIMNLSGRHGLEFGLEHVLNEKSALQISMTWVNDFGKIYTFYPEIDYWRGIALGGAYKLAFFQNQGYSRILKAATQMRYYFAPGMHVMQNSRTNRSTFMADNNLTYNEKYVIRRHELGTYLEIGISQSIGRIYTEMSGGLGFLFRNTKHYERTNNAHEVMLPQNGEYWLFEYEQEGLRNLPYFRLQYTIGYNF